MNPVESYRSLDPRQYPWLASLALSESEGGRLDVEMSFRDEGVGRIIVECAGVRAFRFTQPWTSDMKLQWLDVTDIRDRQMEGVGFEVVDFERLWLSFTSATFAARVA
jgi:hypothetical protein